MSTMTFPFLVWLHLPTMDGLLNGHSPRGPRGQGAETQNYHKKTQSNHKETKNDHKETQNDHKETQSDHKQTQNDHKET